MFVNMQTRKSKSKTYLAQLKNKLSYLNACDSPYAIYSKDSIDIFHRYKMAAVQNFGITNVLES